MEVCLMTALHWMKLLFLLLCRSWALRLGRRLNAWTPTTRSSNSHKLKPIHGTRYFCINIIMFSPRGFQMFISVFSPQIFHKRMPPEAVDLVSRLLQYSPNLRCAAVSIYFCEDVWIHIFLPFPLCYIYNLWLICRRNLLMNVLSPTRLAIMLFS